MKRNIISHDCPKKVVSKILIISCTQRAIIITMQVTQITTVLLLLPTLYKTGNNKYRGIFRYR